MRKSGISYRFLYIFMFILGLILLPSSLLAQVDRDELSNLESVEFINYMGPHSRIETRAQIRGIGYYLGQSIREGAVREGTLGRYFVINSVSPPDGLKLDADIFGFGADVGVNLVTHSTRKKT